MIHNVIVFLRRRKRDIQNPLQRDEDIATENPIYDKDGTPNDETNIQNHTTNNDVVHYHTIDDVYAGPYTRSETKQHENYSKVDKSSKPCRDNTSNHTLYYDRTDVKSDIQPFNEYNHLSTVNRHSQDALGDYARTNINLGQINEGHEGDAETYNAAFSQKK
ncbi:hypothetical protein DPMN_044427 [Dreissena polymorpha]|uniref:Uncharacterized protein n=1 Tax=Dreissena polymorpha TaxID=45954 RepID=A0A9D4D455_DREPO|nr:hypothetical protein DPMN_044427 [Dreissena polymorpha]